ncbi:HAD family hydrolase [Streptomyces sp. GD-15H]|uniref:D-glycero-alpha-D-manno-heptose-1,7-bisphosphate 7-phosphatase n=1 Tax=Streptomyces sp. GD-15H TaxID=3129112 RepID=UPI0032482ED8
MNAVTAVLFDRDGTLVEDVPYNGVPERVRPLAGAREAVALVRAAGLRTAVVTNQSGIGRGLVTADQVRRVNDRVDQLFGAFDVWAVCPHAPDAGCTCRKPRPGLLLEAADRFGVAPESCVLIGDIGADVEAARAAGAHGVLVPNRVTRREEVEAAEHAFPDLLSAVRALRDGKWSR